MNVERHIRRMNRILIAELGQQPLYQWVYSESSEFQRPMHAMDEDGNLLYDYVCPCGLNTQVHDAACVAGALIVCKPKWLHRKCDTTVMNQWVLCCLQDNGLWEPTRTETYIVAMPPETLPGENFTIAVARGRQRSREIRTRDIDIATEYRDERREIRRKQNIKERLTDILPVRPNPGKVDGPVSLPTISRKKIAQGESLVTI